MQKTIIFILALSGIAMATDFSSTTGNSKGGGFGGFDITLDEESWIQNNTVDYNAYTGLQLETITLGLYNTWYTHNNMTTGFGVGIYEKTSESSWSLVGKTDWFQHNSNSYTGNHTFTVKDTVTLDFGTTYTLAFFAGSEYFDDLTIGSERTSMSGATEWKNGQPEATVEALAAVGLYVTQNVTGETMYGANNTTYTTYTPNVTLSGQLVPEPATASLSLLGLAALMIRRRR